MARAKKTTPIADRLLVIACGMIAREVLAVKERNGLDHLDLICLPAEFHYRPNRIPPAMDKAIAEAKDKGYRHIFAGYADCGTGGSLDRVLEKHGVERVAGPHCFAFYQGNAAFEAIGEDDMTSFYMTDFLCRQFDAFFMKPLEARPASRADQGLFRQLREGRLSRADRRSRTRPRRRKCRQTARPRL